MSHVDRNRLRNRWLAGRRARVRPGGCTTRFRPRQVERLEDRALLTTLYYPVQGAETVHYNSSARLGVSSPGMPLYRIYWGSWWTTSAGQTLQSQIEGSLDPIFYSSAFLDSLHEYSVSYRAFIPGGGGSSPYNNTSDPANGFSEATLEGIVTNSIQFHGMPDSDTYTNEGLYVVYTPPGINSDMAGAGGYHDSYSGSDGSDTDLRRFAWIGDFGGLDSETYITSHEVTEAMSDPDPSTNYSVAVTSPAASGLWEICDLEAQNYDEILNGYVAQSHWSAANNQYEVSDGNTQTIYINNGNLYVYGDQLGSNYNDNIALDVNSRGGVQVTLNGETFSYPSGQVSHVYVYTYGGSNTVNVYNTSSAAPVTIYGGADGDTDVIGNSYDGVQGINGSVDVHNPSYYSYLTIDDSGNSFSNRTVSVSSSAVTGLAPAAITYAQADLNTLTVKTGSTTDNISINSTPYNSVRLPYTYIWDAGNGSNYINVYNVSGSEWLYLYSANGYQSVDVGVGNTSAINGTVDVYSGSSGYSSLTVDDSAESVARTVDMYSGQISGIAPGTIYYTPNSSGTYLGGVFILDVYGPSGASTYNVHGTSNFYDYTFLQTGTGNDSVNVLGTTGYLYDYNSGGLDSTIIGNGGLTSGITGGVDVYGAGETYLYVYDYNDTTSHTVSMSDGSISGIAPATISYVATSSHSNGVSYLDFLGSNGGSTYTVSNTSNFAYYTFLQTGTGSDTVYVLATTGYLYDYNSGGQDYTYVGSNSSYTGGTARNINGTVNVYGAGSTYLYVDDSADSTGRAIGLSNGAVTGIAPASIFYTPTSTSTGGVTYLFLNGGSGGNTWTVNDTSSLYFYTEFYTGTGNDTVHVLKTTGNLYTYNTGGSDTDLVSSSGLMSSIAGFVTAYTFAGTTALTLDNSAASAASNVTVTSGYLTGLAPATIYYDGGVTSLTIDGGTGGNTFSVQGTPGATTLNSGTGNDSVNVQGTANPLTVQGQAGSDTVVIGSLAPALGGTLAGITGAVTVKNASGSTALTIDDSGDVAAKTATMTSSALTGLAPAVINYANLSALTVDGGSGGNTFTVASTPVATALNSGTGNDSVNVQGTANPLTVQGQAGSDTVVIGSLAPALGGTLAGLTAAVTIGNAAGSTALRVDDSGDAAAKTTTITSSAITGLAPATISYSGLSSLSVLGSNGGTTFNLQTDTVPVSLTGGAANDTFNLATGDLGALPAAVTVNGGGGSGDAVVLNDQSAPASETYTITSTTVTRPGFGGLTYNTVEHLTLNDGVGGNTITIVSTAATTPVTINASGSNNTLIGPNLANTWTITGSNAGTVGNVTFSDIANLTGGTGNDVFHFNSGGSVTGMVDGGAGANTLDLSAYTTHLTVNLATGAATHTGGFANISTFLGGTAANTLTGLNADSTWNITGAHAGTVSGDTFSGFDSLNGGSGNDIFMFGSAGSVTGTINGGSGTNTLDYSTHSTGVTVNLTTGAATGVGGGVSNIVNVNGSPANDSITGKSGSNTINGEGGVDTLDGGGGGGDVFILVTSQSAGTTITDTGSGNVIMGANTGTTWTITGAGAGTVSPGITFSGISKLTGGTANDTYKVEAGGSINTVDGQTGTNTLDYSLYSGGPVAVNFATHSSTGIGSFANITKVAGSGSAGDTLTGANTSNTWKLTSSNAGLLNTIPFSAFANLVGGTSNDDFRFSGATGAVTGTIDGTSGSDTLDYSIDGGAAATVNLASLTATRVGGGFSHITVLIGSTAATDTLIGPNSNSTWKITSANGGVIGSLSFSSIENLTGGTAIDAFVFSAGKSVSGTINGGGGDWLDYAAYTTPVSVNLAAGTATGTGGIVNIQSVRGSKTAANTLTGNAQGNVLIGGTASDNITGGTGFSILIGDTGTDNVNGGSNNDILIGGGTTYDGSSLAHDIALNDILAEWQSGNPYATRITNIKNGTGLTGGNKLVWGSTVTDDGAADVLTAATSGASVGDWFFVGVGDTKNNYEAGEQVN
jgi:hypothetical protein